MRIRENKEINVNLELPYKDRFVAFLDILGFSKMVYSNDPIDKAKIYFYQTSIKNILQQLKDDIEEMNDVHAKENKNLRIEFNHVVISDSIILTVDIIKAKNNDTEDAANDIKSILSQKSTSLEDFKKLGKMFRNFGKLYNEYSKLNRLAFAILCEKIALLQVLLSSKDIWLRGAITSGETFIDTMENQIIGKAYIDAYKLESNYALYPRVIIDTKLIKELEFKNEKDFLDFYNQTDYILIYNWGKYSIKKDVPLFISFITYIDNFKSDVEAAEFLENIIENIENNLYGDIGLYEKYFWLVEYIKDCLRSRNDNKYDDLLARLKELG